MDPKAPSTYKGSKYLYESSNKDFSKKCHEMVPMSIDDIALVSSIFKVARTVHSKAQVDVS